MMLNGDKNLMVRNMSLLPFRTTWCSISVDVVDILSDLQTKNYVLANQLRTKLM
jgi:hypothetical protein